MRHHQHTPGQSPFGLCRTLFELTQRIDEPDARPKIDSLVGDFVNFLESQEPLHGIVESAPEFVRRAADAEAQFAVVAKSQRETQSELSMLQASRDALEGTLELQRRESAEAKSQLGSVQEQLAHERGRLVAAEADRDRDRAEVAAAREELTELQASRDTLEGALELQRRESAEAKSRLGSVQEQLAHERGRPAAAWRPIVTATGLKWRRFGKN